MQQHLLHKNDLKDDENNNSSFIQKTISRTQLSIENLNQIRTNSDDNKSKLSTPTMYHQTSSSTINNSNNKFQRPKTAIIQHQTSNNPSPSRLDSAKIKPTRIASVSPKKKSVVINRIDTNTYYPKHPPSLVGSETSNYSQTIYTGRPISAIAHRSTSRSNDSACSIREAKGTANRYNKPEELFGLKPEELFAPELQQQQQHQPKILDQRSTTKSNDQTRLKRNQFQRQQHIWQQDVDKIIELYNIHHSGSYRKSAIPPPPTVTVQAPTQTDTLNEPSQNGRQRRASITKPSTTNLKPPTNPKQSTFATLNIPRRNSITRPSTKLTNT